MVVSTRYGTNDLLTEPYAVCKEAGSWPDPMTSKEDRKVRIAVVRIVLSIELVVMKPVSFPSKET